MKRVGVVYYGARFAEIVTGPRGGARRIIHDTRRSVGLVVYDPADRPFKNKMNSKFLPGDDGYGFAAFPLGMEPAAAKGLI